MFLVITVMVVRVRRIVIDWVLFTFWNQWFQFRCLVIE